MDAEGRVSLDERLKASLGLREEAVFVGQGHKFQIWEPSRFAGHLEEARSRVSRLRAERGAKCARHERYASAPCSRPPHRGSGGASAARGGARSSTARSAPAAASRALLDRGANVVALDRDPAAIAAAAHLVAASRGRLRLVEARFGDLDAIARRLGLEAADGVVLDIGVSSMQLDEAERGFSLRFDAPLDMRMEGEGPHAPPTSCGTRTRRRSPTFCSISARSAPRAASPAPSSPTAKTAPFVSTLQLARMIARVAPARRGELTHPATRTFQALRIAVNDELGELLRGLAAAERLACARRPARGRHVSIRSRIASSSSSSRAAQDAAAPPRACLPGEPAEAEPTFDVPRGQPIEPSEAEAAANPRSRSAKLRFAVRSTRRRMATNEALGVDTAAGAAGEARMMWRILHVVAIAALIGSAAYVYGVKYRTIYASEQLVKTRHLIAKEKDAINLLRAEYAHLARPDRLQALADSKLGMQPLAL